MINSVDKYNYKIFMYNIICVTFIAGNEIKTLTYCVQIGLGVHIPNVGTLRTRKTSSQTA